MPSIAKLLVALARDPELLKRFEPDPDAARAVMSEPEFGLTEAQQEIVLSGDLDAIRRALDYEYAAGVAGESLPAYPSRAPVTMVVTWAAWIPTWIRRPGEEQQDQEQEQSD